MTPRADRLAIGAAAAVVASALVYDPTAEAAEAKRTLGLLLATLVVSAWVARPPRPRAGDWGTRAALAFLALSSLSLSWGLPQGARDLGTFCVALGAGMLARQLGPSGGRYAVRLAALGIGGISACVALGSAARGGSAMALHAGHGNPNWFGLLLAVTLPLSLDAALAFRRAPFAWRLATCAACILQVPALYLSHSRVGWLAAGVASLGLWCLLRARPRLRIRWRALPLLLLLLPLLVLGANAARSTEDVAVARALDGRAWIWRGSASAALDALPLGAGLGRFGHAYLDAQGEALKRLTPSQAARRFLNATTAHNEYLQAAVESGPFAALFLAAALALGARAHARRRWLGGAAALSACLITSLADSPLRQPAIALLIGLVLGVPSRTLAPPRLRGVSRWGALAALGLMAFLTQDSLRGWLATRERTRALDEAPRERLARLARSARLDPASGETQLELGLGRLRVGELGAAQDALARADALFADTGTRIAVGQAELTRGRPAAAARAFERALAWNFGSFRARLGLAEARLGEQRLDEAEREALTARKLMPGAARARELLDTIREAKMDR